LWLRIVDRSPLVVGGHVKYAVMLLP
jgi:hypothetical protein